MAIRQALIALLLIAAPALAAPPGAPARPMVRPGPDLTSEFVQPGSGSRAPFINVRAKPYYADNTGANDATGAIQAAITALGSAGGTVLFPVGVFKTTAPIALPVNVRLLGAGVAESWNGAGSGKGTVISNLVNGNTFTITSVSNVTIEGMSFEGSTSTGAHVLVDGGAGAASNIFLTRNTFLGKTNAIKYQNIVFQIHVTGNVMSAQNAEGVLVDGSGSAVDTSLYFVKNWIRGSGADGISVSGSQGVVNLVIDQCQVSDISAAGKSGMKLRSISGASVTNNDVEVITGTGAANGIDVGGSAYTIEGNNIFDVRGTASIFGSTLQNSRIGINKILKGTSATFYAIQLDGGSTGNVVMPQQTDYSGVYFDSSPTNLKLLNGMLANGAVVSLTAQTANLAATNVYASAPAGEYRICATAHTQNSGTGTTANLNIIWTDESGIAKTDAVGTWALNSNTVTGQINKCEYIRVAVGTNIQISVTAGTYGTSTYAVRAVVEKLN